MFIPQLWNQTLFRLLSLQKAREFPQPLLAENPMPVKHGTYFWAELNTDHVENAKIFYAQALGWTFENMPSGEGEYWLAMADGERQAGIVPLAMFAPPGTPPHWFIYFAVDDVDKRVAAAIAAGGTVQREPFDVPDVGRIAIVKDPSGAVMGWITPVERD